MNMNPRTFAHSLSRWCVVLAAALLIACVSAAPIEHSFYVSVGKTAVHDIEILYGQRRVNFFKGANVAGSSGSYGTYAPVPDHMVIRWRVENLPYEVSIPIRDRSSLQLAKLRRWYLRFEGGDLEVWREEAEKPEGWADTPPYRRTKIFP